MRLRPLALAITALALAGCARGGADPSPPAAPAVVSVVQDDAELLHRPPARIAATLDDLRDSGVD